MGEVAGSSLTGRADGRRITTQEVRFRDAVSMVMDGGRVEGGGTACTNNHTDDCEMHSRSIGRADGRTIHSIRGMVKKYGQYARGNRGQVRDRRHGTYPRPHKREAERAVS